MKTATYHSNQTWTLGSLCLGRLDFRDDDRSGHDFPGVFARYDVMNATFDIDGPPGSKLRKATEIRLGNRTAAKVSAYPRLMIS